MTNATKTNLSPKLPMALPRFACPICGSQVYLTHVSEWGADDGAILGIEYECETEPDIDSDEWPDWHAGHYHMPYVDWLPWSLQVVAWLNKYYYFRPK